MIELMRFSIALVCSAALASPAAASDWVRVPWDSAPATGVSAVQIDMDSLTTSLANQYHGVQKTFWLRRLRLDGSKDMGHVTIDCGDRTYVEDSGAHYSKDGATSNSFSGGWQSAPIPPDTDFDAIRQLVCLQ
jgi:hypothetical protein